MRYRNLMIAAALVALAAGGYTVYWWRAASALHAGVDAWANARREAGWRVNYGAVTVDGFPFRLRLAITEPRLASRHQGLAWRWQAPRLEADSRPWRLSRIHLTVPLPHALEVDEHGREFSLHSGRATGLGGFSSAGLLRTGWLRLDKIDVTARDGVASSRFAAAFARLEKPDAEGGLAVAVDSLILPAHMDTPFGRRIARLEIAARITGPFDPAGGAVPDILARWRDAGGTVEFDRISVDWAPVTFRGGGSMALDARLQPAGIVSAQVTGYQEAIDLLVRAGAVRPGDASAARLVLRLMARRPEGGGPAVVKAPLRLNSGRLSVGPVRLLRVPPIDWPRINWNRACGPAAPAGCAGRLR